MRKTTIIISIFFIFFAIIFTILPMEKFGLIAAIFAAIFAIFAYNKSENTNSDFPKYLSMIAVATIFAATYFSFFTKPEEVVIDQQFEQEKVEAQKQDQKDLEDLEGI